jgi:hypothetical protein
VRNKTMRNTTMRSNVRLGIGAGLAATAVLAMAGCSGKGGTASTNTGLGGSVNGSAISLVADSMTKANTAGTVKITGTMSVGGVSMTLNADEQYSPSFEMSMTAQAAGQNISEILIGDRIYMDYPALSAELGGGKQWSEINLAEATGSLGAFSSVINSVRNENPLNGLSALIASKQVTEVGTETVQGQQTTHYKGTLNAAQFLQSGATGTSLSSSQIATLKSQLQSSGVTTETIDLWVGSNGLPVQVKTSGQSAAGLVSMTMDLSDWGAPVQVTAPAASEVTDITAKVSAAVASASAG